ncbi:MAG: chemotaxis response regulator protein-glutamate methylesterase [Rhodocyclales bacterium]|nr:chemotaxis response regulator protein-glutamate methylesterase [Rhodocyclales bacterium]
MPKWRQQMLVARLARHESGLYRETPAVMKIKVLVVDGSAIVRLVLSEIINSAPDMRVVGHACDEAQARQMIREQNPDVMTIDVEMPSIKGLDGLADIMRSLPVLIVSNASARASKLVQRAFELGAVDFVSRPHNSGIGSSTQATADGIRERARAAHQARLPLGTAPAGVMVSTDSSQPQTTLANSVLQDKVVVIGASTGGTEAIREVLIPLPAEMPPILIVQHMPELFTSSFAKRLDSLSRLKVKEAEHDEPIKPGTVYLAPGHSHLSLKRSVNGLACELSDASPVNRHRPSVDVLFLSAARIAGSKALGILLTGMGKDGAQGMLAMRQTGSWTIAQDQDSCVVWGMPREAMLIGGAQEVAPLKGIPERLLQRLRAGERRAA